MLPAPLDFLGLWNCTLYISAEIAVPMVKDGTRAISVFDIPNDISFVGQPYFNQALIIDFGAPNPVQAIVSNAAKGIVGG
jgi:hypothetical protein